MTIESANLFEGAHDVEHELLAGERLVPFGYARVQMLDDLVKRFGVGILGKGRLFRREAVDLDFLFLF